MKTFEETFKDHIDLTDGTVVLTKEQFKLIQRDVLQSVFNICNEGKAQYKVIECEIGAEVCSDVRLDIKRELYDSL